MRRPAGYRTPSRVTDAQRTAARQMGKTQMLHELLEGGHRVMVDEAPAPAPKHTHAVLTTLACCLAALALVAALTGCSTLAATANRDHVLVTPIYAQKLSAFGLRVLEWHPPAAAEVARARDVVIGDADGRVPVAQFRLVMEPLMSRHREAVYGRLLADPPPGVVELIKLAASVVAADEIRASMGNPRLGVPPELENQLAELEVPVFGSEPGG